MSFFESVIQQVVSVYDGLRCQVLSVGAVVLQVLSSAVRSKLGRLKLARSTLLRSLIPRQWRRQSRLLDRFAHAMILPWRSASAQQQSWRSARFAGPLAADRRAGHRPSQHGILIEGIPIKLAANQSAISRSRVHLQAGRRTFHQS